MTDITGFGFDDDVASAAPGERDRRRVGAGIVVLLAARSSAARRLRFSFCKRMETLHVAAERLQKLRA